MDQVAKGIQGRIQPLPASDHSIPATPAMDSIRDAHLEETETETALSISPPPTAINNSIMTNSSTAQNVATNTNTTTSLDDSDTPGLHHTWLHHTSPKYTSPPIGSGGKYMIMSKRASWIDANACDTLESASSPPSCLPERQVTKQRQPSIPDLGRTVFDNNNISTMHKSGSLSLLRGSRQSALEQHATAGSPSSTTSTTTLSSSSSSSSSSTALNFAPKSRQKPLHITTSSLYSDMTDTTSPLEEDNGSTCSAISPLHIAQDKNKSIYLHHGHSPGSSSPLSGEIASASNLRSGNNNNSKRRSSMSLLKNIPSAELASIINGYTGSKPGDTTGSTMANDVSRIKQNTRINNHMHSSSPSSSPSSIPLSPPTASNRSTPMSNSSSNSTSGNNNGIPAYQHSLHSFLKRQLSAPKTSSNSTDSTISTRPSDVHNRDVVEISLNNDEPPQVPTRPPAGIAQPFSSTVYPALFLGGLGPETDITESPTSSRNPSLYINTSGLLHTSAPELHLLNDSMGYFDLPVVEEGVGIHTPLSAPGSRTLPITTTHATYLYQSRLRKISKWCIFNWDNSKTLVFIWVRQDLNSCKPLKLLAKIPASEMTHDDMDLVNGIPWTNWVDEYRKPPATSLPGYSSSISTTAPPHDDVYPYHPLDTSFPSGKMASSISTDSGSVLPSRRISTTSSSSHLPGRSSISYPPPPDHIGSVGYSFHDNGNRMGAFGRIGTSTLLDDSGHSSPVSASMHIRHTIRTRLQAAKNACNNEIRTIMDGLNEYVERGLRYVECLEQDMEQDGPSDDSDDHDDGSLRPESVYHPLQSAKQQGPLSNEQPPFSPPATNNTPVRRRSLAIRLQNIEEQAELSSSETDQSQVTTPSDERLPKQMMMKLLPHQTVNHTHASSLVPQEYPADLKTSKAPSRYTMISEDAYLPTPFILTLQQLITLAQTVLDNSLEVYLENVGGCAAIVSRIQSVGTQWDAHSQWPCREWYVRLLLCVAAFNRVVEWWETERGFWYSRSDKSGTHSRTRAGDMEDADSLPRYRSASETESAWSYMDQQEDYSVSKAGSPYLADVDYSDNNSFSGDYDQQYDSGGGGNINGGSMILQEAVKRGQSNTIVMELTLETTVVQYVSPVWRELIGSDAQDIIGKDISDLMVPEDRRVISMATRGLLQDTLRTVEVQFSVRPDESTAIEMEGKGMLMYNRVSGQPSHTMWVIKPLSHHHTSPSTFIKRLSRCSFASPLQESNDLNEDISCNGIQQMHIGTSDDDDGDSDDMIVCPVTKDTDDFRTLRLRSISEPAAMDTIGLGGSPDSNSNDKTSDQYVQETQAPISSATLMRRAISHGGVPTSDNPLLSPAALLSLPPVLCRVCERLVVAAFFEQHSELCVEVHRTEMDVIICNDSLQELKHLVQELADKSLPQSVMDGGAIDSKLSCVEPDHHVGNDEVADTASDSLSDLPLEGEEHRVETVAMCKELLEILDVALSIPIPENQSGCDDMDDDLGGDAHDAPMVSLVKSKMMQILYWRPPPVDDAVYIPLIKDVGDLTKGKVDSVNRMQDRLEYNETVRLDFQQNIQQGKGWTEYVDDDNMGGDQSSPDGDALTTTQLTSNDNTTATAATPIITTSDNKRSPRKTFLGRFKNWHSKRSKRGTQGKRRKSHSIKVRPHIVEMETIDSPLVSPNTHEKMASSRTSTTVTTATKQQPQPQPSSVPISATSTTSSSTNTSAHRSSPPTIKDYDIIKPISKGAFGSVFLAKKRLTGDYYAIKFLKKSDMIAKNQVTNVKAERMILMTQTDSPFVTKLYYTFQSKDYLYLVLEYLNGGDCSALIKVLGRLPEDWARNYLAEVTLGLTYLYNKKIIHRDLKPDNLLIDQNGHLKLTDFGLSRIGFLDRRVRDELSYEPHSSAPLPTSPAPSRSNTPPLPSSPTISCNTNLSPTFSNLYKHSYFSALFERDRQRRGSHASSSSSCGGGSDFNAINDYSPRVNHQHHHQQPYVTSYSSSAASTPGWMDDRTSFSWNRSGGIQTGKSSFMGKASETTNGDSSSTTKRQAQDDFRAIGTPDYIAPESILGTGHDSMVDWWALGVICYEFLYGYPPFNDDSPDKVFENILSRRIDWHGDEIDVSVDARDFMEKLMTLDPTKRLGANGPEEVKQHPFFKDIDWDNLLSASPSFVPQPVGEEDTTYFDARGATMHDQHSLMDDDNNNLLVRTDRAEVEHAKSIILEQNPAKVNPIFGTTDKEVALDQEGTEFGTFVYKNLPLLEKANEDAIRKIRHDSIVINASSPSSPSSGDLPKVNGGGNDVMSASPTNWFHRSLPAISRKKRNSIFDLAPGSSSMNRPSASSSSSSLNHFACTTSLPTTPRNLSPSTSSKIMSTSPTPCIPITPPRNLTSGISKDSKGKSTLLKNNDPSARLRSVSSPGNRLFSQSGSSRITKSFADIMHSSHFEDQADLDKRKSSTKSEPYSKINAAPPSLYTDTMHPHQIRPKHNPVEPIPPSMSTSDFIDANNSPVKPERLLDCLLAEDNPISCKILETILERLNCRCVIARNGAQAIRYATGDVQFDLIFMDIRMPIIDGEAVARMIKSVKNLNQDTPIIAVTAYERTVKLADTFNDIVSKPVTKEMVEQRIRTFCHRLFLESPPPGMTRPIMIPPSY